MVTKKIYICYCTRFLGHYTSSIQFEAGLQEWRWLDMKSGQSVASRTTS